MGYGEMLGLYKGMGKGAGPGVPGEEAQGGAPGMLRAAGGAMKGAGQGLMVNSPRLAAMNRAQDQGQYGAYRDMLQTQHEQDQGAQDTDTVRQIFGGLEAVSKYFQNSNSPVGGTKPSQM